MDPLTLALLVLAAARITRALTVDDVGQPYRAALVRLADRFATRTGRDRYAWIGHADTLGVCPWCTGFWVSVVATALTYLLHPVALRWLCAPWALSYAVGILATRVEPDPGPDDYYDAPPVYVPPADSTE